MTNLPDDKRPKVRPPTGRELLDAAGVSEMLSIAHWEAMAAATLSFKQRLLSEQGSVVQLSEQICRNQIKLFGNKLDRAVYGSASRRYGKRVRRIPVLEKGMSKGWHCHCLLECPAVDVAAVKFRRQVLDTWRMLMWSGDDNRVDLNADTGFLGYAVKPRSKDVFEAPTDAIIFEALVNPAPK